MERDQSRHGGQRTAAVGFAEGLNGYRDTRTIQDFSVSSRVNFQRHPKVLLQMGDNGEKVPGGGVT